MDVNNLKMKNHPPSSENINKLLLHKMLSRFILNELETYFNQNFFTLN